MKYQKIMTIIGSLILTTTHFTHAAEVKDLYEQVKPKNGIIKSDYAKTKYPIIFAHGVFGFKTLVGFNVDYWYQILPDLARNSGNVWATQVSTMNSSEVRGEQALAQVEEIMAITGAKKVNLLGHSHGGHTVRYVAGVLTNDKVASVTTVASPNQGAKFGDVLEGVLLGTILEKPALAIFDLFIAPLITAASGVNPYSLPQDSKAALQSLTKTKAPEFNRKFPNGVPTKNCAEGESKIGNTYYYSFMGNSAFNTPLDPSDYGILLANAFGDGDGDGIAPRCSSRFGKVLKENYRWNHLDEVNQVLGIRSIFSADPVQVYREHANRLKQQGL